MLDMSMSASVRFTEMDVSVLTIQPAFRIRARLQVNGNHMEGSAAPAGALPPQAVTVSWW